MKKIRISKLSLSLLSILSLILIIASCKNDPEESDFEAQLYSMGRQSNGFVWYKNSSEQLNSSSLTGHAEPKQRTRYNTIAASSLDSNYKIIEGTIFQEGSLIVKELYKANGELSTLAMLYKKSGLAETDEDGWVWGYYEANGDVKSAANKKGSSCRGCHSQDGSIDFNLMNLSHP